MFEKSTDQHVYYTVEIRQKSQKEAFSRGQILTAALPGFAKGWRKMAQLTRSIGLFRQFSAFLGLFRVNLSYPLSPTAES